MKGKAGLRHVKRDDMIETGGGCGHDESVHPAFLDCMRPFKVLYRSDGQAKAARTQDLSAPGSTDISRAPLRRRMAILRLRPNLQ